MGYFARIAERNHSGWDLAPTVRSWGTTDGFREAQDVPVQPTAPSEVAPEAADGMRVIDRVTETVVTRDRVLAEPQAPITVHTETAGISEISPVAPVSPASTAESPSTSEEPVVQEAAPSELQPVAPPQIAPTAQSQEANDERVFDDASEPTPEEAKPAPQTVQPEPAPKKLPILNENDEDEPLIPIFPKSLLQPEPAPAPENAAARRDKSVERQKVQPNAKLPQVPTIQAKQAAPREVEPKPMLQPRAQEPTRDEPLKQKPSGTVLEVGNISVEVMREAPPAQMKQKQEVRVVKTPAPTPRQRFTQPATHIGLRQL